MYFSLVSLKKLRNFSPTFFLHFGSASQWWAGGGQVGPRGARAPSIFGTMNTSALSSYAQLRFVMVVHDSLPVTSVPTALHDTLYSVFVSL